MSYDKKVHQELRNTFDSHNMDINENMQFNFMEVWGILTLINKKIIKIKNYEYRLLNMKILYTTLINDEIINNTLLCQWKISCR